MGSMVEVVSDPARRRGVVDDCVQLIDAEVASKRGLGGFAVKAAFKTVKGVRPGMIEMAMDGLIDDFAVRIDPIWTECKASNEVPRTYFTRRKTEVANALLQVTDDRASRSKHRVLKGAYGKLRSQALDHIGAAMPRFADLVQKHTG